MGRPIKTKKYQEDLGAYVDYGFPNDGTTDNGYDDNQPGVVGGIRTNSEDIQVKMNMNLPGAGTITATTGSATVTGVGTMFNYNGMRSAADAFLYVNGVALGAIQSIANATSLTLTANSAVAVSGATYTFDTGVASGSIFRQKSKKKFMVVENNSIQDEGIANGGMYIITSVSDTDWQALGAGPDAGYGKVFTASANGVGLTTNGVCKPVAVCTLSDDTTPPAGEMYLEVNNDGTTTRALELQNHWVRDFDNANIETGTHYVATIFNDGGNVDAATGYTIVGIENYC